MLPEPLTHVEIFDGATGTSLTHLPQAQGHVLEELNLLHPDLIVGLHRQYLEAGAQYLTTNTFSINPLRWKNSPYPWTEVAHAAIACARQAVAEHEAAGGPTGPVDEAADEAADEPAGEPWAKGKWAKQVKRPARVMLDLGPTGRMMEPLGSLTFEEVYESVKAVVLHTRDRVDGFLLETFSDLYELRAAVLAVKENTDLPLFATMTFDASGRTLTGSTPEIAALTLTALGVDVLGANCSTAPEKFVDIVRRMRAFTHLPLLCQPNRGLPQMQGGRTYYHYSHADFAHWTGKLIEAGAAIVGGCCGTTPETIRAISVYQGRELLPPAPLEGTYICSATRLLRLDKAVVCGERLNPTGKKKLQQALLQGNFEYLQKEALHQAEAGADFLDLNTGLAQCDEKALLCRAIRKVQEVCDLPLQLDTSDPRALAAALRLYNGVPMVNSINGSEESLQSLLPLLARYGCPTVALPLDHEGIPPSAPGRLAIARRIMAAAEARGIPRRKLVFDALVMTVSSHTDHGAMALDTLQALKALGCLTTVGLSNISFGLPERPALNRTFLAMALERGLDIPILNPLDRELMQSLKAWKALRGLDPQCAGYIAFCTPATAGGEAGDLYHAVATGLKDSIPALLEARLAHQGPQEIISDILIPALTYVGQRFEEKTLFLPQLIQAAEAAKAAFEGLAGAYGQASTPEKGRFVLATVFGDIHDIGKNIVKVVAQSHGFEVIDLGKNVPAEEVVRACRQHRPLAVGLSALMTTTVANMEATVRLLHRELPQLPVIVGGAVLTPAIAQSIGAGYYAQDALNTVHILEGLTQTQGAPCD